MKAVVIQPKDKSELEFISNLMKKLGIRSSVLQVEDIEDLGLAQLMKEADRTKKVSRETIMKKLKS